jgi:hypothetical protein
MSCRFLSSQLSSNETGATLEKMRKKRDAILWGLALVASAATCRAEVVAPQPSSEAVRTGDNSVMFFGGRLSTTDFASTVLFNLNYGPQDGYGKQGFDNYIAGIDYERNALELARDLRLRAEVGVDDRFGHYRVLSDLETARPALPRPHGVEQQLDSFR